MLNYIMCVIMKFLNINIRFYLNEVEKMNYKLDKK